MFGMLFHTGASLILANFRQILTLKYDFDLYKRFFMEKMAQIHQISKELFYQYPNFV
jgi:hypothetical protein